MYASSSDIPELWSYLFSPEGTYTVGVAPCVRRIYTFAFMKDQRKLNISIRRKHDCKEIKSRQTHHVSRASSAWHVGGQARENIRAVAVSPPKILCSCRIITFRFWPAFSHGSYLTQEKRDNYDKSWTSKFHMHPFQKFSKYFFSLLFSL